MSGMRSIHSRLAAIAVAVLALGLLAVPVFGVDPSPSPSSGPSSNPSGSASTEPTASASTSTEPTASAAASSAPSAPAPATAAPAPTLGPPVTAPSNPTEPGKPGKPDNAKKGDETPVTLKGLLGKTTAADGDVDYTLTVGSTVYTLSAGPRWWWGASNPLAGSVGKQVTIAGEQESGSTEVDVFMIDGTVVRAPGKPPWAGGWKVVGQKHPGWSQEKWDRWQARLAGGHGHGLGKEGAPGQLRKLVTPENEPGTN
jgi:hypothetical protein